MPRGIRYAASESLSVAGTAVGFTAATRGGANNAFVVVEGGSVRFWADGTTPTATVGAVLNHGDTLELDDGEQVTQFLAISKDGATVTLRCQFGS
jgi:hypothetical protein